MLAFVRTTSAGTGRGHFFVIIIVFRKAHTRVYIWLHVKAVSLTVSNADFFSDFSEAGINQTLQTLKVKFTISLTILTTVGYESVDVDSDVMVAQTVIVGRVPETYVNLGHLTTAEGWDQYGTETADRTADPGT